MKAADIDRVAIVGAGTMGAGFGVAFSLAGLEVHLFDISGDQLDQGLKRIGNTLRLFVDEKVITGQGADRAQGLIRTYTDLTPALTDVPFVLEAVPESLELKRKVFRQIEAAVAERTVLASNTSALPITEIASGCQRPELVCGMHWWNPPETVRLVEVIKGAKTAEDTARLVYDLAERLDYVPIMVKKDIPGFVGNRMQVALFREAMHLLDQGVADPEDIDRAIKYALGLRWSFMGLLETADLGGLDVWNSVTAFLYPRLANNTDPSPVLQRLVDQGRLGVKSGRGFLDYHGGAAMEAVRKRDLYFIRQRRLAAQMAES